MEKITLSKGVAISNKRRGDGYDSDDDVLVTTKRINIMGLGDEVD